jgi:hypothetical protein
VPPLAAVPDLDRELDELYALPLDEFTKARNDLSTRLRKAHQSDAAAEVRGLKKPSLPAWAANHLARAEPALVRELIDAGAQLRNVQQGALAGRESQAAVTEAAARERDALRALVAAARSALGRRATPQLLDRLSQTLRAAAVDPRIAPLLETGRLTEDVRAVGFGPLEAVAPHRRRRPDAELKAARERVKELRAEARRLSAEAQQAEKAAADAERDAARRRDEAAARRREADRAATELSDAEAALRA